MYIDFGPSRRLNYLVTRYPELAELRTMLEGLPPKESWNGKHFLVTAFKGKGPTKCMVWLRQNEVGIDFTESEWSALRELFQQAWAIPELQRWYEALHQEYGEQG